MQMNLRLTLGEFEALRVKAETNVIGDQMPDILEKDLLSRDTALRALAEIGIVDAKGQISVNYPKLRSRVAKSG